MQQPRAPPPQPRTPPPLSTPWGTHPAAAPRVATPAPCTARDTHRLRNPVLWQQHRERGRGGFAPLPPLLAPQQPRAPPQGPHRRRGPVHHGCSSSRWRRGLAPPPRPPATVAEEGGPDRRPSRRTEGGSRERERARERNKREKNDGR
jgi:hypothetical protein